MADDNSYMAFLEKANQPLTGYSNAKTVPSPEEKKLKALDEGVYVPSKIASLVQKEDLVYMSDADEPFEPVALKWEKKELPNAGTSCF